MTPAPETVARIQIDALLSAAGWLVQDVQAAHILAGRGVALREFPLAAGHGFADYLLYIDGRAAGVIEAKKVGVTLTGVEIQSDRYSKGLPAGLPAWYQDLKRMGKVRQTGEKRGARYRFVNSEGGGT